LAAQQAPIPRLDLVHRPAVRAYGLLLLSGIGVWLQVTLALHGVAVALVLLLVVGIRNAWDMVIWVSQKDRR